MTAGALWTGLERGAPEALVSGGTLPRVGPGWLERLEVADPGKPA